MDSSHPIIVVGCPRSGATMLRSMLHAHPRIAVPPETGFVLSAWENRRSFGDLSDPARRAALGRWIVSEPAHRFAGLGLDPQATIEGVTAGPATLGGALGTVFQAYADRLGKSRWGAGQPAYLRDLDAIRRLFPAAQIVNIVRDGRDCVAGLKESAGLHAGAVTWGRAVDDARRAAHRLRRDQFFQLRYEDLVADAPGELVRLCAFLGESYDPAMAFATRMIRAPRPRTWQPVPSRPSPLTGDEIAFCEAALGSRLIHHGYVLSGTVRPRPADLLRFSLTAISARATARLRSTRLRSTRLGSAQLRSTRLRPA